MISLIWVRDVCIDWALIVIAITIACNNLLFIPLSIFIVGNRQHALALLGHEATHKLVSKNKYINDTLGNLLCFAPIGLPYEGYKKFHMDHHRFLGTDKDPEVKRKKSVRMLKSNATKFNIITQFFKDLLFINVFDLREFQLPKTNMDKLWIGSAHLCFILYGLFVDVTIIVVWYGAMLSSLLACSRLRIWHEHIGTNSTHKIKANWWQKLLFLPHNAEYHYEHHKKASVPYDKLPEIASKQRKRVTDIH